MAFRLKDTIKIVKKNYFVQETPDKRKLWTGQTLQVFKSEIIKIAHEKANAEGFHGHDEACLVERLGYYARTIKGDYNNIKITTSEDLILAAQIIRSRSRKK